MTEIEWRPTRISPPAGERRYSHVPAARSIAASLPAGRIQLMHHPRHTDVFELRPEGAATERFTQYRITGEYLDCEMPCGTT